MKVKVIDANLYTGIEGYGILFENSSKKGVITGHIFEIPRIKAEGSNEEEVIQKLCFKLRDYIENNVEVEPPASFKGLTKKDYEGFSSSIAKCADISVKDVALLPFQLLKEVWKFFAKQLHERQGTDTYGRR